MKWNALEYVMMLLLTAGMAGSETRKRNFGWAVVFGLMFFAVLECKPV